MSNGFNKLGSGVIPLDDGNPPTDERGAPSALFGMTFGLPALSTLQAEDELETNPKLTFPTSISTYHLMRTDAQVQGLLTGATWPLQRMRWYIDENGASEEIVTHCSEDYNLPIGDGEPPKDEFGVPDPNFKDEFNRKRTQHRFNFMTHLEEALEAIAYGFEIFEQVGYIGKDGRWHLRKLAMRPPHTITEINLAKDGGINFVRQGNHLDEPLSINRLLVYPFQKRGANWHGRSLLRGCYAPWLLKDRAMRIGAMNLQRAGVGTPVATGHPGASESDLKILDQMARRLVAGDRSGGAIPYGATLRMIGVEGSQPDAVEYIKLLNEEMARSFFQMFMQLGQTTSGSRALGQTFVEYHKLVMEYVAMWFAAIFNEYMIEDDIEWNWGPEEEYAPLLCWKWDEQGSEQNPEGPVAARNPAQKVQKMTEDGHLQVGEDVKAVIFS